LPATNAREEDQTTTCHTKERDRVEEAEQLHRQLFCELRAACHLIILI